MKNIAVIFSGLALFLGAMALYYGLEHPKVAFVDLNKVYNEFNMKKELEGKLTGLQNKRKTILDSLEIQINMLTQSLEGMKPSDEQVNQYQTLRQQYAYKQQQFEEDNNRALQSYDQQIWKQLNQYTKEFGSKKDIDFLHGADGTGALMHANESYDLTDELIAFINMKYVGAGK